MIYRKDSFERNIQYKIENVFTDLVWVSQNWVGSSFGVKNFSLVFLLEAFGNNYIS